MSTPISFVHFIPNNYTTSIGRALLHKPGLWCNPVNYNQGLSGQDPASGSLLPILCRGSQGTALQRQLFSGVKLAFSLCQMLLASYLIFPIRAAGPQLLAVFS